MTKIKPLILLKGDYVFHHNTPGHKMYFVRTGSLEILVPVPNSTELKRIGSLWGGSSFGEISMLLGEKRTASIKAEVDCELAYLESENFFEVLQVYSKWIHRFPNFHPFVLF